MLLSGYAGAYGMATCALRFSNVYGPGMAHKDSFVPRLMRAALAGSTVRIYGDGTQRRDLVHVDDVVRGVLLGWDSGYTGRVDHRLRAVGVGAGARRGRPPGHRPAPADGTCCGTRGEMPAVVLDLSHSADVIGYRPAVDLADGLASTWRYFRDEVRAVTA